MSRVVFVPCPPERARGLRAGESWSGVGCTATDRLRERLGDPAAAAEEVDFAAQEYAGVAALLSGRGPRLVIAADVAAAQLSELDSDLGEVAVSDLGWSQVLSLFADEPAAAASVAQARTAVAGLDLAAALGDPSVTALTGQYDLLWFAVEELDQLG